jgi:hypothetical protein
MSQKNRVFDISGESDELDSRERFHLHRVDCRMLDELEITLPDLLAGLIVLSAFLMLLISAVLIATVRRQHTTQQSISRPPRVSIACPGGGVYFWWQIGALKRLLELYELPDGVPLSGASAGALAVCLSQCSVDPATAYKIAFGLAVEADVFRNPLGLCGKWGRLVYAWLDQLLPVDAGERCSGRCRVVVTRCSHATPLRPLRIEHIDAFSSRAALIDALMASTHIPFFMDGRPTSARLGGATVDGALLGFLGVTTPLGLLLDDQVIALIALIALMALMALMALSAPLGRSAERRASGGRPLPQAGCALPGRMQGQRLDARQDRRHGPLHGLWGRVRRARGGARSARGPCYSL